VRADLTCAGVAAASVLAKCERDAIMVDLARKHPEYGWALNKGYSAPDHVEALRRLGPTPLHRRSWNLPGTEDPAGAEPAGELSTASGCPLPLGRRAPQGWPRGWWTTMGDGQELGRDVGDAAAGYLEQHGMQVVARNWRCRHGEIDIIASEGAVLVFCEVKTRRGTGFGVPLAAITATKLARMRRLAALWLEANGGHRGPVRIDALGLMRHRDGSYEIEHLRGVC
jgi:putative endonuclease